MALVVLTEPDVTLALRRLMKRVGILLVAYSVTLIKYFPAIGRGFDYWSGVGVNRGTSPTKNELGYVCMLFGVAFFWNVLGVRAIQNRRARWEELVVNAGLLGLVGWLAIKAQSATSTGCLIAGMALLTVLGLRFISNRFIAIYAVAGVLVLAISEQLLGLSTLVVGALGRDATLTDRTQVWTDVLEMMPNTLLGAGFESFWLGPRLDFLYAKWWWRPTQAHNGYIEAYINLGSIGAILLVLMILWTLWRSSRELLDRFELGRFELTVVVMIVAYNFTEATFKSVHPLWTMFHIVALSAIASPRRALARQQAAQRAAVSRGPRQSGLRPGGAPAPVAGHAAERPNGRRPVSRPIRPTPGLSWPRSE
jgi:O-antigen ligase